MKLQWSALALIAITGCSESPAPAPTDVPVVDADVATVSDGGSPADAGNPSDVPPAVDVPTGASVVINEVRAVGDDWIELKNVGTAPVDLGGLVLADTDTSVDGGAPRPSDGVRFPAGTSLAPGQHLLVVADLADAGAGPQMTCLGASGPMTCFHAGFGISASRGERLYLLQSGGAVVATADYPANAVVDGRTWGRLPDGTGPFAACAPTPGSANAAP
ncbi:MAG: lamin tail domain-containing protein [Myxococcaceae bacterium]|nr:MAG: lamin tail domain-containing protein [Myxococcaceae bacterium]